MVLIVLLPPSKAESKYRIYPHSILKTGVEWLSTKLVQVMKTYSVKRIQELTRKHLSKDKTYKCKRKHRLMKQRAIPVAFLRQRVHSCFTNSLPLLLKLKRICKYVS